MSSAQSVALAASHGQGLRQIGELGLAFVLASVIGLERQYRGKSAGLRTQTIVGTAAALILLVSKYGFGDVLASGTVVLVGFLGAGLIITRRGTVQGLTTAAAVWETAAIGMAAGAGLPVLAVVVTVLHFVVVLVYRPIGGRITGRGTTRADYTLTYTDGRGVLRSVLAACTTNGWAVSNLARHAEPAADADGSPAVSVTVELTGSHVFRAGNTLALIDGVRQVSRADEDDE